VFGVSFGEILLILILIFLISPKELPNIIKQIGIILANFDKIKKDLFEIKDDFDQEFSTIKESIKENAEEIHKKEVIVENKKNE